MNHTSTQRPVVRIRVIGHVGVEGRGADLALERPRVMALLLLLAGHRTGLARDRARALLWPEDDEAHADDSLRQHLSMLRRALGQQAVAGPRGRVALEPTAVRVDLWELEEAAARHDHAGVVARHAGPFAAGWRPPRGLDALARWCDERAAAVRRRVEDALEALARAADARADHAGAVRARSALLDLDPLSARRSVALMRTLAAAGDYTAALHAARSHAALVRAELDCPPDPSVTRAAAELRRALALHPSVDAGAPNVAAP